LSFICIVNISTDPQLLGLPTRAILRLLKDCRGWENLRRPLTSCCSQTVNWLLFTSFRWTQVTWRSWRTTWTQGRTPQNNSFFANTVRIINGNQRFCIALFGTLWVLDRLRELLNNFQWVYSNIFKLILFCQVHDGIQLLRN
jgi:hypothetical protein